MATYKLPDLQTDQSSSSAIILYGGGNGPTNGLNGIAVGWQVSTIVYETSDPRLFTFWTIDDKSNTGCVDFQCAGFVSTNNIYGPGSLITQFSTYGRETQFISILISRDYKTGNWWVTCNNEISLGYFPKELLPKMEDNALLVQLGGFVNSPLNVPSPPMGSGHPSNEGFNKAAYFIEVQFVDEHDNLFDPYPPDLHPRADISDYYSVADNHYADDKDKYVFAYGGAGGFK
ncbi:uncharacterized protein LOC122035292 [Zingiber officinale]|uniref:uncharacterized protein LOC122035292 n=1 Tax=Zingiber officinale TaxID=94328 RepID=UPI001C4D4CD3|nr:uncharacterized protein LOC122035292 [Zingiber officinale]